MGLSLPWSPKVKWGKSGTESDESSRDPSTVGETSLLVTSFSPPVLPVSCSSKVMWGRKTQVILGCRHLCCRESRTDTILGQHLLMFRYTIYAGDKDEL